MRLDRKNSGDTTDDLGNVGKFKWSVIFKIFLFRLPLWLVLTIVLGISGWFGFSSITSEEPVNLRPAVTDAQNVKIVITTCNEQIDKQAIDIRTEERNLENDLEEKEGVKNAEVLIERDQKNCKENKNDK